MFEYQDSIESAWLDTDPSDLSDFPDSLIANLGPVLEVMLSDEGEAKVDTSIINLVDSLEWYTGRASDWCVPFSSRTKNYNSSNYSVKARGILYHITGILTSNLKGSMRSYKKRNGKLRKHRTLLKIKAEALLRKSPTGCERIDVFSTGWKVAKKRSYLSVNFLFWLNPQIMYKHPWDSTDPSPDGLISFSTPQIQDAMAF